MISGFDFIAEESIMIQYSTPFLKRWRQTLSIPIVFGAFLALILSFMIPSTWRENSVSAQPSGQFNGGSNIREKVRAPEFDGGVGWLNVERPLRLTDLRSKIVLLDFWTYCCINCMHIIPDLKKLEKKYEKELVVIGVHSAKFLNEKETENIRNAILRYEIEHPVVNDANFKIWQAYGARGWPHLVLIDPEGYFVGETSGEGNYDLLDRTIKQLLQVYQGKINPQPIPLALEKNKEAPSILSFPGKILADSQGKRLFISDSNHNRIVITDMNGNVTDIAGIGTIGKKDGSFADAQFHHPQGMVLAENFLYVADTENHLLRRIDLSDRTVKTIAGTGVQALGRSKGGDALQTALNSPWD